MAAAHDSDRLSAAVHTARVGTGRRHYYRRGAAGLARARALIRLLRTARCETCSKSPLSLGGSDHSWRSALKVASSCSLINYRAFHA